MQNNLKKAGRALLGVTWVSRSPMLGSHARGCSGLARRLFADPPRLFAKSLRFERHTAPYGPHGMPAVTKDPLSC